MVFTVMIAVVFVFLNVDVPIKQFGDSERFTKEELSAVADLAHDIMRNAYGYKRSLRIYYDEKRSDMLYATDYADGKYDKDDTVVIFVDFLTGLKTGSWEPHSLYTGYNLIFTRGEDGRWVNADAGYP